MEYVRFGNTGMQVSRFCLGAMTFGGKLDRAACKRVVDEALDQGVNFIDTADSYGDSEEVLGEVVSPERRDKVFLTTKVFRRFCRDGRVARNCRTNIISSLERSLRLLKTDYVDLYQLHHPDEDAPIEETLETLDTLVTQGKVRYVGVSNHYAWQMAYMLGLCRAHAREPLASIQANYNVLDRQVERSTVPFCNKFNIAMMCYGPLCGGILTGKYMGREQPPEGTRAAGMKPMQEYLDDETVQRIVEGLAAIAEEQGLRMNQLAILWLVAKPHATTIILGGTKPEHFTQILEVADRRLPEDVVQRIDELSAPRVYTPFMNQSFRNAPGLGLNR